jgi:methyl-accepting chemotaxis protein
MILVIAIAVPAFMPQVRLAVPIGYVLTVILGSLLLGDTGGRWSIGACAVALVVNTVLAHVWTPTWFPSPNESINAIIGTVISLLTFLITAVVARQVAVGQEESFGRTQRVNLRMERLVASEQRQRERLENTVDQYVQFMQEVREGNLGGRILLDESAESEADPLIVLGHSINETVASLQGMISRIHETAGQLGSASTEILTATTQQAASANQQSAAIAQASTTIDEVRTIAEQTARRAQGVSDLAQRTTEVSHSGQQAVADTVHGMEEVKSKVETIASNVLSLSDQAQAIGQIITVVSELSNQSNMLSLNAAVEAARAGEAGKGFSVVAGEVRKLAEQSRAAAEQIQEILSEIQGGINTSVMATEEGMKGADAGSRLATEAGLAIRRLAESVTESTQAAIQISAAAGQQQTGMEQISQAMDSIHQATAQSVAGARQVEQASGDLNDLAAQLRELVARYRF